MTGREEVERRMRGEDPKAIVLATESLDSCALAHIPYSDGFILGIANDELVSGVEEGTRDIVEMTPACIHFPRLGVAHSPEFDLTIVASRHDQRQRRMERGPAGRRKLVPPVSFVRRIAH